MLRTWGNEAGKTIGRWAMLSAAVWLGGGCAHQAAVAFQTPASERSTAVGAGNETVPPVSAHASPIAEAVAPADAWWLAEQFVRERSECEVLVGSGGSMLPLYRDRTVVVVQRMEMEQLRPGMTVVFFGDSGRMVAHVLVAATPRGWIAQGMANRETDRTLVRQRNYIGTVIKAYAPDPRVASLRVKTLPVASSGPTVDLRGLRTSPEGLLALAPARGN